MLTALLFASLALNVAAIVVARRRHLALSAPPLPGATDRCPACGKCVQITITRPDNVEPVELTVGVGWMG